MTYLQDAPAVHQYLDFWMNQDASTLEALHHQSQVGFWVLSWEPEKHNKLCKIKTTLTKLFLRLSKT